MKTLLNNSKVCTSLFFSLTLTYIISLLNKQDAQLSQRDRAAGCVTVFAKSRRLELGDNILRTL